MTMSLRREGPGHNNISSQLLPYYNNNNSRQHQQLQQQCGAGVTSDVLYLPDYLRASHVCHKYLNTLDPRQVKRWRICVKWQLFKRELLGGCAEFELWWSVDCILQLRMLCVESWSWSHWVALYHSHTDHHSLISTLCSNHIIILNFRKIRKKKLIIFLNFNALHLKAFIIFFPIDCDCWWDSSVAQCARHAGLALHPAPAHTALPPLLHHHHHQQQHRVTELCFTRVHSCLNNISSAQLSSSLSQNL